MDGAMGAVVVFIVMIVAVIAGVFIFTVWFSGDAEAKKAEHDAKSA